MARLRHSHNKAGNDLLHSAIAAIAEDVATNAALITTRSPRRLASDFIKAAHDISVLAEASRILAARKLDR